MTSSQEWIGSVPSSVLSEVPATQREILLLLKRDSTLTLAAIGEALDLSASAIRHAMAALCGRDLVAVSERRRARVGRPALEYRLTAHGEQLFPSRIEFLLGALEALREAAPASLTKLAERVGRGYMESMQPVVQAAHGAERIDRMADGHREKGFIVSVAEFAGVGRWMEVHHCPLLDSARIAPEICAGHRAGASILVGDDLRLHGTLVDGASSCRFTLEASGA